VPGAAFAVGQDLSAAARLCFASNPPDELHTAVIRLGAAWRASAT
jgi:2-aminoadipate transaminase